MLVLTKGSLSALILAGITPANSQPEEMGKVISPRVGITRSELPQKPRQWHRKQYNLVHS